MRLIVPTALTLLYVGAVFWSLLHGGQELEALKLNELGDFIAGFLGPIALIWLVTGIFLQSYEMRANTNELERSRMLSEEALRLRQQDLLIRSRSQELAYIDYRRKIRSGYSDKFVYLDHDDAGFLRPPYKSKYDNKEMLGDFFAAISRKRIIVSVRNYGIAGRLSGVEIDDDYRHEPAFKIRFTPSFHSVFMPENAIQMEPILDLSPGSRYKMVFEFDKTIEPRIETKEQVDFEGRIYLSFDTNKDDEKIQKITQEVEFKFMFDEGDVGTSYIHGIADESILKFHPTAEGEYFREV